MWIADAGRGSVLGVATDSISGRPPSGHKVFADYGPSDGTPFSGSLSAPASLSQAGDGSLVVADGDGHRVVDIGTIAASALVKSLNLDCGLAKRKRFVSIRCTFASVPMAQFTVSYRIDGGSLHALGDPRHGQFGGGSEVRSSFGAKTILLPPLTIGTRISYWVMLSTGLRACAPELLSLAITYEPWHAKPSGKGGGGASGNRADSSGSASDNSSSAGGGSGSGGGTGGGSGSGSGGGSGSGRGTGSRNSTGASSHGRRRREHGRSQDTGRGVDLPGSCRRSGVSRLGLCVQLRRQGRWRRGRGSPAQRRRGCRSRRREAPLSAWFCSCWSVRGPNAGDCACS